MEVVDLVKQARDGVFGKLLTRHAIRILVMYVMFTPTDDETQKLVDINLRTSCLISFTPEELRAHYQGADAWNSRAEIWTSMQDISQKDGWTSDETYDQALGMFVQLRKTGMEGLSGEARDQFEKAARWVQK